MNVAVAIQAGQRRLPACAGACLDDRSRVTAGLLSAVFSNQVGWRRAWWSSLGRRGHTVTHIDAGAGAAAGDGGRTVRPG